MFKFIHGYFVIIDDKKIITKLLYTTQHINNGNNFNINTIEDFKNLLILILLDKTYTPILYSPINFDMFTLNYMGYNTNNPSQHTIRVILNSNIIFGYIYIEKNKSQYIIKNFANY